MTRPSIFIGSSSEGLPVSVAVKSHLENENFADVNIWNEGELFKLNQSTLDSLIRSANLFDFAILCLTPDDVTRVRDRKKNVPRDNVVFELGLFLGRLGRERAFIVCDEKVNILSDFSGITMARYCKPTDGDYLKSVKSACEVIRSQIERSLTQSSLSFLPSTSLAIGYFENFIAKVRDALIEEKDIRIDDEPIAYRDFELKVLIPRRLSDLESGTLKRRAKSMKQVELCTTFRRFPFYMLSDFNPGKDEKLCLIDIPTTLLASGKAIDLILRRDTIGPSDERDRLEVREINNFKSALEHLTRNQASILVDWL